MRTCLALAATLLMLLTGAPAMALSESGSHGWSRDTLVLRDGPGDNYDSVGRIDGQQAIKILRCQKLWCVVDGPGGRGWARNGAIDFGQSPDWPLTGPVLNYPAGDEKGEICFYEGANFTGRFFCRGTGFVAQDLATLGWDNRVSSIEIRKPGVSVAACRDRFLQSYCTRVIDSQPRLGEYLRRNLSSIRIY